MTVIHYAVLKSDFDSEKKNNLKFTLPDVD